MTSIRGVGVKLFASKKRRLAVVVLAVVVAGGGTGAWALTTGGSTAAAAGVTRTSTATASTSTVEQTVAATGTIEPAEQDDLGFAVSGTVTSVKVAIGDVVTKGQTLATLDPTDLERAVEITEANVDAAQALLDAAQDAADPSDTQITSAKAAWETARDKLAAAEENLEAAELKAPFAGTIASVTIAKGDRTSGSGMGGAGGSSGQITLVGTKSWTVDASVSGSDLDKLAKDQQARITLSGVTQQVFGTVSSVGVIASSTSGSSSSFPVTIKVTGSPEGLHPGASATVTIVTASVPDVLTIPTNAIRQENGTTVVTKLVGTAEETVEVVVGTTYGMTTEITSGLVDGDQVRITSTTVRQGTGNSNRGNGGRGQGGAFESPGGGALPQGFPAGGFAGGGNFGGGNFGGGR